MDKWEGLVAVVTGASSGIGRAVAIALAEHGMIVVAVARRQERLAELVQSAKGKGKIIPMPGDVRDEKQIEEIFKRVESEIGFVRVLVNNAGVSCNQDFLEFDMETWRKTFDVNVFGVAICTKHVVHSSRKNKPGLVHIININSLAGHSIYADPNSILYSCSKHCITYLTRQFIKSTAKDNIKFTSFSPGIVDTEIFDVGGWNKSKWGDNLPMLKPEQCADSIINVLSAPPDVVIAEFTIKPLGETI